MQCYIAERTVTMTALNNVSNNAMQCNAMQYEYQCKREERGRVVQWAESFPQSGFKVQEFARKLETQKVGNETQS